MKPHRIVASLVLMFCFVLVNEVSAMELREKWTLWPGESYTFQGVTVIWEVSAEDKEASGPLGRLKFRGPETTIGNVDSPIVRKVNESGERTVTIRRVVLYLDDVVFMVVGRVAGPAANLVFEAMGQTSEMTFSAAPQSGPAYISSVCPLSLNQWKLSISDKPVKYPDGSELLELTALDSKANTKVTLPLAQGAMRRFGRFNIMVDSVSEPTRTARLKIEAQADKSIRGRDAYVAERLDYPEARTYGEFLDRMAEDYGFEVEWVAFPDHPESVQFAQDLAFRLRGYPTRREDVLQDHLEHLVPELAIEWKDPTHLRVSAKDYDQVVARREESARRSEENKRLEEQFKSDYAPITQLYRLADISAATALALIKSELDTYYLLESGRFEDVYVRHPQGIRGGYFITSSNERPERIPSQSIRALTTEHAAADERTNVLIVTAIAGTQRKIGDLIAGWEHIVAERVGQGAVKRYRIEVILLQGGKAGEKVDTLARGTKLSFRVKGLIEDLPAREGMKVKARDVVARLDSAEAELQLRRCEVELSRAMEQLELARREHDMIRALHKQGQTPVSDLNEADASLAAAEAQVEMAQIDTERVRRQLDHYTLRAPASGTVESVPVSAHETVETGQVVATLIPDETTGTKVATAQDRFDPKLASRFGITQEDLDLFGFDAVAQLGKGVVTLSGERGDMGRVLVSLTEAYRCELEFQDVRPPYVIVRGRLREAQSDKPLLENTLFLEKDKPSLLGLTNLRQALILVLRLHDMPQADQSKFRKRRAAAAR